MIDPTCHRISRGGCDTHTPGRGVGYEHSAETGNDDRGKRRIFGLGGEVEVEISRRPVFCQERSDKKDWDGEKLIIECCCGELTIERHGIISHAQSNLLSYPLKPAFAMRFLINSTNIALKTQLAIIQAYPTLRVATCAAASAFVSKAC